MNRSVIILLTVAIVLSCKGTQKAKPLSGNINADSCSVETVTSEPVTIRIDDEMKPMYDTLRLNETIKSVEFIPLSSSKESYIGGFIVDLHNCDDYYYVTFGEDPISPQMKAFDKRGQFMYEVYHIGRGPNEIISSFYRTYNDFKKNIIVDDSEKFLIIDMKTHNIRKKSIDPIIKPLVLCSFKDGGYVARPLYYDKLPDDKLKKGSYLIFYDSIFNVIGSVSDNRDRTHRDIEGVTTSPILKPMLWQSGEKILYKDMDNDTIFSVKENGSLIPSIIIDIPDKLKPTIQNSIFDSRKKKQEKIYLRRFYEMKDYILISYDFKDMLYTRIWSKSTQELVFLSPHRSLNAPFCYRTNNLAGHANYYDLKSNSNVILTTLPASVLKGKIDGLSDDDNPVIVKITLKDNYNPVKQ